MLRRLYNFQEAVGMAIIDTATIHYCGSEITALFFKNAYIVFCARHDNIEDEESIKTTDFYGEDFVVKELLKFAPL